MYLRSHNKYSSNYVNDLIPKPRAQKYNDSVQVLDWTQSIGLVLGNVKSFASNYYLIFQQQLRTYSWRKAEDWTSDTNVCTSCSVDGRTDDETRFLTAQPTTHARRQVTADLQTTGHSSVDNLLAVRTANGMQQACP